MLTLIGLSLVVLAWAYQLLTIVRGGRGIRAGFALLYALGVLSLVANDLSTGFTELTALNLISFALAFIAFLFLIRKR